MGRQQQHPSTSGICMRVGHLAVVAALCFAALVAAATAQTAAVPVVTPAGVASEPGTAVTPLPAKPAAAAAAAATPTPTRTATSAAAAKPAAIPKPVPTPAPKPAAAAKAAPTAGLTTAPVVKLAAPGAVGAAGAGAAAGPGVPQPQPSPPCEKPCYTVADYWPYKTCRAECAADVCKRGWGAWSSQELCCSPGAAFPDGCSVRPKECWVAETASSRTCWKDDRKCLQGYGVWPSQAACCSPGAAFPDGCVAREPATTATAAAANKTCWVIDTYFPARLCRSTANLCSPGSGVKFWDTKEACCAQGAAFSEGCSAAAPPTPCYMVGSYWPSRTCVVSNDVAVCNRGWGVYVSEEVCCAPNMAFSEGCSAPAAASVKAPAANEDAATAAATGVVPDSLK